MNNWILKTVSEKHNLNLLSSNHSWKLFPRKDWFKIWPNDADRITDSRFYKCSRCNIIVVVYCNSRRETRCAVNKVYGNWVWQDMPSSISDCNILGMDNALK